MQSICDKEQSSSVRSSDSRERLFRLLAEEDSDTSSTTQSKKRKLSEKVLANKLTERSKKISSENELLYQMEDEADEGHKAKKSKSTQPTQAISYHLKLDDALVRNISIVNEEPKDEGELPTKPLTASGRWISIKGLDAGGGKIWIPSSIVSS